MVQVEFGEGVVLSAQNQTCSTNISYQWYKDDTAILGATAATYTIASADTHHIGNYKVIKTYNYAASGNPSIE